MCPTRAPSYLSWIAVLLVAGPLLEAQDEPQKPAVSANRVREQTIYIPYEKLRETFEREGRGVFLPYEKFQQLWQAARRQVPRPARTGPPVKALITQVDNEAAVEKDVVRVHAMVQIDVLGKGWIEVPLRLKGAALLSAQIDSEPARLIPDDGGGQKLLLKRDEETPQRIELQLEYAKSIDKGPGQNSVTFQPPLASVSRWRIRIPQSGVRISVQPMLAATEVPPPTAVDGAPDDAAREDGATPPGEEGPAADNSTTVLAFVGAAPTVRIQWTPKAEGAQGLGALVSVRTEQQVAVDQGITRTRTRLDYEVSRAELSQLTIELPADQRVVDVVDANVRQWDVQTQGQMQRITVGLFQPAGKRQTVVVESEKFTDDSAETLVSVPVVRAIDVGRQLGVIGVRLAEGLRAEPVRRTGVSQLDASEIPPGMSNRRWAFVYRYAAFPLELSLKVEKIQPRIHVDQLVEVYLEPRRMTIELLAQYDIQRAGVFEFSLDVPGQYEVRQVRGQAVGKAKAADVDSFMLEGADKTRLKVNLGGKALGRVGLLVQLEKRLEDANLLSLTGQASRLTLTPPRVAPDRVQRATGRLMVYAPESLRIGLQQLRGLRNVSLDQANQNATSMRKGRFPGLRCVQSLAFATGPASVTLTAERRQPQVSAHQMLVVRVEPGVVRYEATFHFTIRYSSAEQLRIDVPADLADRIRNETSALRETTIDPPPDDLEPGYVAWSLTGETELIGSPQCKLTWETPIEQLAIGNSIDLAVPRLVPRDVDLADGQIVLVKAETIDLKPKGRPQGLDPIDPQHNLLAGTKVPGAAVALEFHGPWQLVLTATRYQLETLKHTSIERAVLRMVITRSDRVAVQALYRLRSNRQRLQIQLPAEVGPGQIEFDTDPLRINGQPVTLERGGADRTFFVPLAGRSADEPLLLELRYTAAGNGRRLEYPVFPDEPAVQLVQLVAYVPRERAYLGSRGPWTDQTEWSPDQLLNRASRPQVSAARLIRELTSKIKVVGDPVADFPTDGYPLLFSTLCPAAPAQGALRLTTVDRRGLHALVLGIVGLGGVLLLRRSIATRIVALCGLAAALVLVGALLPTLAYALLDNILVLAVMLVILLWLVALAISAATQPSQVGRRDPSPEGPSTAAKQPEDVTGATAVQDAAGPAEPPPEGSSDQPRRPPDQDGSGTPRDEEGGSNDA